MRLVINSMTPWKKKTRYEKRVRMIAQLGKCGGSMTPRCMIHDDKRPKIYMMCCFGIAPW